MFEVRGDVRGKNTMGLTKTPSLYQAPKAEHFKFLLMHSVISGGGPGCVKGGWGDQSWEDYGFEILEKSPGLYKVPKLRNLNFCCCTVCFLCLGGSGGGGWVGEDFRGGRTMGLRSSRKPQVSIKSQC